MSPSPNNFEITAESYPDHCFLPTITLSFVRSDNLTSPIASLFSIEGSTRFLTSRGILCDPDPPGLTATSRESLTTRLEGTLFFRTFGRRRFGRGAVAGGGAVE